MTCSGVEDAGAGTGSRSCRRRRGAALGSPLGAGGVEATVATWAGMRGLPAPPGTPLGAAITAAMAPAVPLANGGRQALAGRCARRRPRARRRTGGFSSPSSSTRSRPRGRDAGQRRSATRRRSAWRGCWPWRATTRAGRPQPPGPDGTTAPARSSGCCSTGGPGTSTRLGSATFQDATCRSELERAWRTRTAAPRPGGPGHGPLPGSAGHVVADVTIAFARDAVDVRIGFEPSGQLSGLRLVPPPFPAAER